MVNLFKLLSGSFGAEVLFVEQNVAGENSEHSFKLYSYTGQDDKDGTLVTSKGYSPLWAKPANVDSNSFYYDFHYDGDETYPAFTAPSYRKTLQKLVDANIISSFEYKDGSMVITLDQSQYDALVRDERQASRDLDVDEYIKQRQLYATMVPNGSVTFGPVPGQELMVVKSS